MLAFALLVSDVGPLLWGLVPIAAGLYFFARGFSVLARRRLITSTPQSKIRSAAVGLVEVSGLAVGPHTVHAPISGLPCFYYRTIAWEHKDSGRSNDWQKVAEEILYVPFFLDDGTGKLLIDPRGAELDLHRDFRHEFSDSIFSTADSVPYNVRNFLLRHGVSSESKVRVEEYCIKPKNALFIVGTLAENPQYRGKPPGEQSISHRRAPFNGDRTRINTTRSYLHLAGDHTRIVHANDATGKSCRSTIEGGDHETRRVGSRWPFPIVGCCGNSSARRPVFTRGWPDNFH